YLFFFLLLHPPPISTLFPYTTLFRSVQDTAVVLPSLIYRIFNKKTFKLIYDDHELPNENESIQYRIYQFFEKLLMRKSDIVIFADRKSTRLNSSHVKISYAVFCLKKK